MSTRISAGNFAGKDMDIIVADAGNADDDKVRVDTSVQDLLFQEVPYVDADCDNMCEAACQIPGRRPREQFITRIPTKVELKTLSYMAKRPTVDIEFQDLTYSVRNPGRRTGKLQRCRN
jgi:hypothetical protein